MSTRHGGLIMSDRDSNTGLDIIINGYKVSLFEYTVEIINRFDVVKFYTNTPIDIINKKLERNGFKSHKHFTNDKRKDWFIIQYINDSEPTKSISYEYSASNPNIKSLCFHKFSLNYNAKETHQLLKSIDPTYKISTIELDWDIYPDNEKDFYGLRFKIDEHLFEKYNQHEFNDFKSTSYSGNLRKKSKGFRVYSRSLESKDGNEFIRIELPLKRTYLRNHNIHQLTDLNLINEINFERLLAFKELLFDKIVRYIFKKLPKSIQRKRPIHRRYIAGVLDNVLSDKFDLRFHNVSREIRAIKDLDDNHWMNILIKKCYTQWCVHLESENQLFRDAYFVF